MQLANPAWCAKKYTGDMRVDHGDNSVRDLQRRFDAAADSFDEADYVHRATFAGLIERLDPVTVHKGLVLDLGSAACAGSEQLSQTFGKSRVISVDLSARMLGRGNRKRRLFSKVRAVQADALSLPIRDGCVDLAFANMLLPWISEAGDCFGEVNRVLRKDAVFAFASLGPELLCADGQ